MELKQRIGFVVIALAFLVSLFLPSWIASAVSLGYLIISAIWFKSEKNQVKAISAKAKKGEAKDESEEDEELDEEDLVKCRFCKKLYSSEYNGCPYCKKK